MNGFSSSGRHTLVLSCSPRKAGNSDSAAELVGGEFAARRPGLSLSVRRLSDIDIRACTACDYCAAHPGRCSMAGLDETNRLLSALCAPSPELPVSVIVSPIHFYHLPARLKALLDRRPGSVPSPLRRRGGRSPEKPGRDAKLAVVLLAARRQGARLFEGSLLTLRYVASALGLELVEPLTLYGLDAPDALSRDGEAQARVREYARSLVSLS